MNTAPYSLFSYWRDDSTRVEVNPYPPSREEALPFHVVVRSERVIPVSYLVFARSQAHAEKRVRAALETCARESRSAWDHRAVSLLEDLASGELTLTVSPMDTDIICAQVNWACNGGLG